MIASEKRRVGFIGIILALFTFLSFYFDNEIIRAFSYIRVGFLDDFFLGITFASSLLIIFLFLTAIFLKKGKRKWILPLWATIAISFVVSFILKVTIQRQRPYQIGIVSALDVLQKGAHIVWDYAFPSMQAVIVFSAVPFLSKEFPKFKYIWIVFASLVALSRVYFGVHFFSDVFVGGIIGYLIGWLAISYKKGELN